MALKKQHKARWNCNMGKYQPGRGTWPTPHIGKWPDLKFRLGTNITPPPPTLYLSILWQTYAWLCLISHCIFVLYSYTFVQNFHDNTMPCINNYLSEYWTTLPLSKSRPLKTHGFQDNLMVSRREYFHFCLEKYWLLLLIFMRQLCRNPQFTVLRHIHLYSSYLIVLLTR